MEAFFFFGAPTHTFLEAIHDSTEKRSEDKREAVEAALRRRQVAAQRDRASLAAAESQGRGLGKDPARRPLAAPSASPIQRFVQPVEAPPSADSDMNSILSRLRPQPPAQSCAVSGMHDFDFRYVENDTAVIKVCRRCAYAKKHKIVVSEDDDCVY